MKRFREIISSIKFSQPIYKLSQPTYKLSQPFFSMKMCYETSSTKSISPQKSGGIPYYGNALLCADVAPPKNCCLEFKYIHTVGRVLQTDHKSIPPFQGFDFYFHSYMYVPLNFLKSVHKTLNSCITSILIPSEQCHQSPFITNNNINQDINLYVIK